MKWSSDHDVGTFFLFEWCALLRTFLFFIFYFCLRIALKSPFFTAPAPLYQSSKGNHSSSIQFSFTLPSFVYSAAKDLLFFSTQNHFIIPTGTAANAWRYYCDSGSCGAKFGGQVASPVGKLRINAPPKNPATIVIREPRARRESGELVNSSVRQT